MKLKRLYSNQAHLFDPIKFESGLNVIFAEIKHPKDSSRDSHNLGKSTLITLLDFMLLKKFTGLFLEKHQALFSGFEFYLELLLNDGKFLTIKRAVSNPTKISFYHSEVEQESLLDLPLDKWTHEKLPFDRARMALDGFLNLEAITPYTYRQGLSYFLRGQDDYKDVFQMSKFRGKHISWKPYLGRIFGFDDKAITRKYEVDEALESQAKILVHLRGSLPSDNLSYDKVKGQLEIKGTEVGKLEKKLDSFEFLLSENQISEKLVNETETRIAELREELYEVDYKIERIKEALKVKHEFNLKELEQIFDEAKLYFSDQLKNDYTALVKFNTQLTEDRNKSLADTLRKLLSQQESMKVELGNLDAHRASQLASLTSADTFKKFKTHQASLVEERATVEMLKTQLKRLDEIVALEKELRDLKKEREVLAESLSEFARNVPDEFSAIRQRFAEIVRNILDAEALLFVNCNGEGNLEFEAEIVRDSETLETTSESEGTTYKKLLCMAFDMAVLKFYSDESFYRFVYHDGALEGLDNRKKLRLLEQIKKHIEECGLQYILSAIDTDLPRDDFDKKIEFPSVNVVCHLNDSGDQGRLFKMPRF